MQIKAFEKSVHSFFAKSIYSRIRLQRMENRDVGFVECTVQVRQFIQAYLSSIALFRFLAVARTSRLKSTPVARPMAV